MPKPADTRQAALPGFDDPPPARNPRPRDFTPTPPGEVPDLTGKTVWVVDANSLIFQVFHAIPEMTSPQGEPVNAVFGFARDLLFLLDQWKPDYLFCAFDREEPTFRHELFADYKGQRSEFPEDLAPQFPAIHRLLAAFGIPQLECPGYEADDVLAKIAHDAEAAGGACYLVTGDKDCRQLISDRVKVFNVRKNQVYGAEELAADWGIRPKQVVDFQSLVGDPIDNVPGVPLIGPKIAAELLNRYGTLEGVLAHATEVAGAKRKANLIEFGPRALASRRLVRLETDVPMTIDWDTGRTGHEDREALGRLFAEWGFRGLTRWALGGEAPRVSEARRGPQRPAAADSSPRTEAEPAAPPHGSSPPAADFRLVATPDALAEFLAEFHRQEEFALATLTTHAHPMTAELVGVSFSWNAGQAYYLPLRAPAGERRLDASSTLAALKPALEAPHVRKVGQNLKYDLLVLRQAGVELAGVCFDTMVAGYLLDSGARNHALDDLAARYLQQQTVRPGELLGSGKSARRLEDVPPAEALPYAGQEAELPWRLRPILAAGMAEQQLEPLFRDVEMPLVEILADMELRGVRIDAALLAGLAVDYGRQVDMLREQIFDLAGHPFNIDSPKQLQQVLFAELKLPALRRTKTGPSTDADVLEELAAVHPLPQRIIEYRQFTKLKGTYVDALPALVHPQTGRVHATFNQVVAATGRLSSSDPNLQNIPVRARQGREIRAAFLPGPEGWKLLAADYSQIELRILAHLSGDPTLAEAFARDEDIHARVAAQVFDLPLEAVGSEQRRGAKAVNFGVIYGQSPFGLARQLGISKESAAAFIDAYFARYPRVDEFLSEILAGCASREYVTTILGRRRAIRGVRIGGSRMRNLPERTAINTVIQGSAADLIKLAMIAIHRQLRDERLAARMILQIHDELVFEAPPEELEPLAALVRREMTTVLPLDVPLKVDVKSGRNWAEVESWD